MARAYAFGLLLCVGAPSALAEEPLLLRQSGGLSLSIAPDSRATLTVEGKPVAEGLPLGAVRIEGTESPSTSASLDGDLLRLSYGDSGARVFLRIEERSLHLLCEVVRVEGAPVERLTILDLPLTLAGSDDEEFAVCALALDLETDVPELPGRSNRLRGYAYPRFGLAGARLALVGGRFDELRESMKQAVLESAGFPTSSVGGPWALEGPMNRSSYLFNFSGLSEATVDEWIALARSVGFDQIQFHGGSSFRFGDCALDPATYPEGEESLRRVIDKLHQAGIRAGMQPYAFFLDKRSMWVSPVPDPRLATDTEFTLAADLPAEAADVPVLESTEAMSTITGFFVHNSVTLRVDQELIVYSGVTREPPYGFTQCQRGAHGTTPAAHAAGARVGHLKECFGLFVPDPETSLFQEVAARTADLVNRCGFDAIYFDALDGEAILGGADNAWHYGSAYVYEVLRRLDRPTLMEMSTFHHHLWFVRSRMGAWDHPSRCHKLFIDRHLEANASNDRMFLPGNLGWWAFKTWGGPQIEPTFSDDIEYLCARALGTDSGLSLVGYAPTSPAQQRLADITRRWETVRRAGSVSPEVKARLRAPGEEWTLEETPEGPRFVAVRYERHTPDLTEGSASWPVSNPFGEQTPFVRIEALSGVDEEAEGVLLEGFTDPEALTDRAVAPGVEATLALDPIALAPGPVTGAVLRATSSLPTRSGSWLKLGRVFAPARNLSERQALAVWVRGDGKGEVLNFQLRCPSHVVAGLGEHYVTVDFTGWRRFVLVEPDAERWSDYAWPYGHVYSIYRESVEYSAIEELSVWANNLPPGDSIEVGLGPVEALPLASMSLATPSLSIGAASVRFPVTLETGSWLEWTPGGPARHYSPEGALLAEVEPVGEPLLLPSGASDVSVSCEPGAGPVPRARVTLGVRGEAIGG